jgi:hypothetical protein
MWGPRIGWLPREYGGSSAFGTGSPYHPRHNPNDVDRSPNEAVVDKIQQYHTDYHNRPSNTISFIPGIVSTSGRIQSEFVCPLFLQVHRETDRFFAASGVQHNLPVVSSVASKSHTHPSHSQTSRLLTLSPRLSLGVPVPNTDQCMWVV